MRYTTNTRQEWYPLWPIRVGEVYCLYEGLVFLSDGEKIYPLKKLEGENVYRIEEPFIPSSCRECLFRLGCFKEASIGCPFKKKSYED